MAGQPQCLSAAEFADLLAKARSGSKEAKEKLLLPYQEVFDKWATQRIGYSLSPLHDSDLTQEIFLSAWSNFLQFEGDTPEALDAWMRRIFENGWNTMYRFHHRSKRDVSREVSSEVIASDTRDRAPDSLSFLVRSEEQGILREALANLSPEELHVVVWRYFYGQDYKHIGTRLGCLPDAARMLCHRAKKKLRELLSARGHPDRPE